VEVPLVFAAVVLVVVVGAGDGLAVAAVAGVVVHDGAGVAQIAVVWSSLDHHLQIFNHFKF
jgi:hypothetical protein